MPRKPDYGIDAPGVIRNLFVAGGGLLVAVLLVPGPVAGIDARLAFQFAGAACLLEGLLMLLYVKVGKFRHRDRMLAMVPWRGDEAVLDVGTGRGLLAIGAAKKAPRGKSIGIDIWSAEDLSGNSRESTLRNVDAEGVAGCVEIRNEDARAMSFPAESFDVVLSNLCLHNIPDAEGRAKACREIVRVLKPGGVALVSDFRKTREYEEVFREAALVVTRSAPLVLDTFPPLRIVRAEKAREAALRAA
jgi:arsenite methyltransferase